MTFNPRKMPKKSTSLSVKCFKDFIETTDSHVNIEDCSKEELNGVLR